MKKIKIAERLHPFSHDPGTSFLLPLTSFYVRVFPTRIFIGDVEESHAPFWIDFHWTGPVKEFTAQVDLERDKLIVFGRPKEGYICYQISRTDRGVILEFDRAPPEGVSVSSSSFAPCVLHKRESLVLVDKIHLKEAPTLTHERLSLGVHKEQDLFLMRRRKTTFLS